MNMLYPVVNLECKTKKLIRIDLVGLLQRLHFPSCIAVWQSSHCPYNTLLAMNIKTYPNSPCLLQTYVVALCTLSFLFLSRIIGQMIQYFYPVEWLPSLESWQGSSLPYVFLLASQLIILVVMLRVTYQHASGCVRRNPNKGRFLMAFGALYFVSMSGRLVIGLANLSSHPWFNKAIPTFFHLVLATFVLLIAGFHMNWVGKSNKNDLDEAMQ
ncbi:MAG: hypothetical protein Q7S51_04210 [Gallionellaceae bacterium]|nr:hypothetical protein [Gallionellaceae bacterium]